MDSRIAVPAECRGFRTMTNALIPVGGRLCGVSGSGDGRTNIDNVPWYFNPSGISKAHNSEVYFIRYLASDIVDD